MKLEVTRTISNTLNLYTLEWLNNGESYRKIQMYEESFKALEEYFKSKKVREKKKPGVASSLQEVKDYFKSKGYTQESAIKFHEYYTELEWLDRNGKPVKNWKAKAISVWFKPENKIKEETKSTISFFQK